MSVINLGIDLIQKALDARDKNVISVCFLKMEYGRLDFSLSLYNQILTTFEDCSDAFKYNIVRTLFYKTENGKTPIIELIKRESRHHSPGIDALLKSKLRYSLSHFHDLSELSDDMFAEFDYYISKMCKNIKEIDIPALELLCDNGGLFIQKAVAKHLCCEGSLIEDKAAIRMARFALEHTLDAQRYLQTEHHLSIHAIQEVIKKPKYCSAEKALFSLLFFHDEKFPGLESVVNNSSIKKDKLWNLYYYRFLRDCEEPIDRDMLDKAMRNENNSVYVQLMACFSKHACLKETESFSGVEFLEDVETIAKSNRKKDECDSFEYGNLMNIFSYTVDKIIEWSPDCCLSRTNDNIGNFIRGTIRGIRRCSKLKYFIYNLVEMQSLEEHISIVSSYIGEYLAEKTKNDKQYMHIDEAICTLPYTYVNTKRKLYKKCLGDVVVELTPVLSYGFSGRGISGIGISNPNPMKPDATVFKITGMRGTLYGEDEIIMKLTNGDYCGYNIGDTVYFREIKEWPPNYYDCISYARYDLLAQCNP